MRGDLANWTLLKTAIELLPSVGVVMIALSIKIQYPGTWYDDIRNLADLLGTSADAILAVNPWLLTGNVVQDDHNYTMLNIPIPLVSVPNLRGTGNSYGFAKHEAI